MIEISGLTKHYSQDVKALDDISLSIDKGVFGLLGRNGSGKTTLLRIITTLLKPTEGSVKILGMEVREKNYNEIKRNIGYLPQEFGFYKEFTVQEIMDYICIMRDIDRLKRKILINEALQRVNLYEDRKKKYKNLSGGMKRRAGLAQAMIGNPEILIVDEPTAGVDPQERIRIRKLINEYGRDHIVIFSTHIIEDIEYTCEKLAVLDFGKLVFNGSVKKLLSMADGDHDKQTSKARIVISNSALERAYVAITMKGVRQCRD